MFDGSLRKRLSKLMSPLAATTTTKNKPPPSTPPAPPPASETSPQPEVSVSRPDPEPVVVKRTVTGLTKVDQVFDSLCKQKGSASLGSEGVVALLKALAIGETDVTMLVFLYKCKCVSLLDISREEFNLGMDVVGASDLSALKSRMPAIVSKTMTDSKEFADFFKYVFQACREGTIKSIPKESAIYLLPICFSKQEAKAKTFVDDFCAFLDQSADHKFIKGDEWSSFLTFSRQVQDIKTYEESGEHWPLIIDGFVEWMTSKKSTKRT